MHHRKIKRHNFSNSSILNNLTLIYKGYLHLQRYVCIPNNKYTRMLAGLLLRINCISGYRIFSMKDLNFVPQNTLLELHLLYIQNLPVIQNMHFVSSPGRRQYITFNKLKFYKCKNKQSIFILNTSIGLITGEEAMRARIGGELICIIN